MEFNILVLDGDGIGPEVVAQGVRVLSTTGKRLGHRFNYTYHAIGGAAIDTYGNPLRNETIAEAKNSDAILVGAVGGPKWDDPKATVRPEQAILGLRKALDLFANLRPVKVFPSLKSASPVRSSNIARVDMVVVRESTGGLYFGKPKEITQTPSGRTAVDSMVYSEEEIHRILKVGFEIARSRRKKLTSVDKANVLATSRLWRDIATEMGRDYPDIMLDHILVDTASILLIKNPRQFDVIVTENTFGDILTDEASVLTASLGMLPSATLAGSTTDKQSASLGLYEPIHGSAPDIAGTGKANPIGTILSAALLCDYSLGLPKAANMINRAVEAVIRQGHRTSDISKSGQSSISTEEMGHLISRKIETL
jgi:3-isopropylmalate dehydrogenase